MLRSSWRRAVTALLLVMVCALVVPVKATAAVAATPESAVSSTIKIWMTAWDWTLSCFRAMHLVPPVPRSAPGGDSKFGAGHSSDGHPVVFASGWSPD